MKVHFFDNDRALADETWDVPADAEDPRAWALRRAAAFVEGRLGLQRPVPVTVRDSEGEWDVVLLNGGAAIDAAPPDSPGVARAGRGAGTSTAPGRARTRSQQDPQRGRRAQGRRAAQSRERGTGSAGIG